jgi:hypothetical protein
MTGNETVTSILYQALRFFATWLQQDTMIYVAQGLEVVAVDDAPGQSPVAIGEPADRFPTKQG